VPRAEPEKRAARVDVLPVVVGVRDVKLARILAAVAVAVSGERSLPVVVEVGAGRYQFWAPRGGDKAAKLTGKW
jgi:hypothetical protein